MSGASTYVKQHDDQYQRDVMNLLRISAMYPGTAKHSTQSEGPQPLPDSLPPVPVLQPDMLPVAIRQWCVDLATQLQVPLDFTGAPAVVGLAGALGRAVAISVMANKAWIEVPVLWGCIIGRPSSGKSPALSPTRGMLDRLESAERNAWRQQYGDVETQYELARINKDAAKSRAKKAAAKGNQSAALTELSAAAQDVHPEPRIVLNDATVAKIGDLLNQNPRGLLLIRDELTGWMFTLDRDDSGGDRAFFLESYNGKDAYTIDRIGRGTIRVDACAVWILGGIQPGRLAEYVRGAVNGGHADDGLIQRLQMAVYPDLPRTWKYIDRPTNKAAEDAAYDAFLRLRNLDAAAIGAEQSDGRNPPCLRFTRAAQTIFAEWLTGHMTRLRNDTEAPWLESHLAKYPALAARLALVLHLAEHGKGDVTEKALSLALRWVAHLEAHARRIYSPAADSGITSARLLLKHRKDLPEEFSARDVYRHGWSGLTKRTVHEALEVLIDYQHLIPISCATGGRPSVRYVWWSPE